MTFRTGIGALVVMVGIGFAGLTGCGSSSSHPDGGTGTAGSGGTTGTGGAGGAPATSGVTGTKRIDALTTAEKQQFCDWLAAHFGGYGHSVDCGNGSTLSSDPNQATCVAGLPTTCASTVSQWETCANDISCSDSVPASCTPVFGCL